MNKEIVFIYALTQRDQIHARLFHQSLESLGVKSVPICPDHYSQVEMDCLTKEMAAIGTQAIILTFQSTMLEVIKKNGHYFKFSDLNVPILIIIEDELIFNLFYFKDYISPRHHYLCYLDTHFEFYQSLGFNQLHAIPPFLTQIPPVPPVSNKNQALCITGSVSEPNEILNSTFQYIKSPQTKAFIDHIEAISLARHYSADQFMESIQAYWSQNSFMNPFSMVADEFFSGINLYLNNQKLIYYLSRLDCPIKLYGKCGCADLKAKKGIEEVTFIDPAWTKLILDSPCNQHPLGVWQDIGFFSSFLIEGTAYNLRRLGDDIDKQLFFHSPQEVAKKFEGSYQAIGPNTLDRYSTLHTAQQILTILK